MRTKGFTLIGLLVVIAIFYGTNWDIGGGDPYDQ